MNDPVVLELIPDHFRASHRAAHNFGIYPYNGSVRVVVEREFAEQVIAEDDDKYAHIVCEMTIQARKRSGISGDRAYRLQEKLVSRVDDIINTAIHFHLTHDQMYHNLTQGVFNSQEWERVPTYVRAYLQGYLRARKDDIYRIHLVWMLWLDGKLRTSQEIEALTKKEQVWEGRWNDQETDWVSTEWISTVNTNYQSPWQRIKGDQSRHVWLDKPGGTPLPDKVF